MPKTPKPIDDARYCPLIKQGCIGDACAWWVEMWGVDDKGQSHLDADCSIPWLVTLGRENLVEAARTAASYDKAATNAAVLSNELVKLNP